MQDGERDTPANVLVFHSLGVSVCSCNRRLPPGCRTAAWKPLQGRRTPVTRCLSVVPAATTVSCIPAAGRRPGSRCRAAVRAHGCAAAGGVRQRPGRGAERAAALPAAGAAAASDGGRAGKPPRACSCCRPQAQPTLLLQGCSDQLWPDSPDHLPQAGRLALSRSKLACRTRWGP